jgi:hypothetical protein
VALQLVSDRFYPRGFMRRQQGLPGPCPVPPNIVDGEVYLLKESADTSAWEIVSTVDQGA